MNIRDTLLELEKIKHTYRDLIITSNFKQVNGSEISWNNYTPGIYKNLYAKEYETLVQNRQYSFLLSEKMGFMQFYFKFKDDGFEKVKMAYYPYPIKLKETLNEMEQYHHETDDMALAEYYFDLWNILNYEFSSSVADETLQKIVSVFKQEFNIEVDEAVLIAQRFNTKYEITNSSHIRVDFDNEVDVHHKCEVQIGAINNIRVPIDRVISPFVFFDFIAKNLYREFHNRLSRKVKFQTDFSFSKQKGQKSDPFEEINIFLTHL